MAELGNKAKLSRAKLGLRLSLAIKEGSKYLPNTYKVFPLYTHYQNFQIESISLLFHILSRVAQAMCWVAQAMWSRLRRLCGGFIDNRAKLSPAKLGLRLSLAIKKVPNAFPISTNYLHSIPSTKKISI